MGSETMAVIRQEIEERMRALIDRLNRVDQFRAYYLRSQK